MAWRFFWLGVVLGASACSQTSTPPAPGGGIGGMIDGAGGGGAGAGGSAGAAGVGGRGGAAGGGGIAGNGGGDGSAGVGGVAGSGGIAGNGGDGGSAGAGGVGPSGACDRDDSTIVESLVDPAMVRATSAACAISPECEALLGRELVACVAECVELAFVGLSEPCATCYGELESCSSFFCANACSGDACTCPTSSPCADVGYAQCQTVLSGCTGPLPVECNVPD